MGNAFVFVVCGANEHIETLHYAIHALEKKTSNEIIVITDSSRNESPVRHKNVLDIATPAELTHHQASIYLKTSIYKFLPKGNTYVYLDSDVIAIGEHVDGIFEEFIPPIRFAPDHCRMPAFSPYAVNCNCQGEYQHFISKINARLDMLDPIRTSTDEYIQGQRNKLSKTLSQLLSQKPRLFLKGIKYMVSWPHFRLNEDYYYDRKESIWYDRSGRPVMSNIKWRKLAKELGLKYNPLTFSVKFPNGKNIWIQECDHLPEYIHEKFGISISDKNFRHWNGGVFIFNDSSHAFLETWHTLTMEIFKDPKWKTRDQGTLIAAIFSYKLEKQELLHKKWNYICDYNNPLLKYQEKTGAVTDNGKDFIQPEFVHIYHHFGDKNWDFWNWTDNIINRRNTVKP